MKCLVFSYVIVVAKNVQNQNYDVLTLCNDKIHKRVNLGNIRINYGIISKKQAQGEILPCKMVYSKNDNADILTAIRTEMVRLLLDHAVQSRNPEHELFSLITESTVC